MSDCLLIRADGSNAIGTGHIMRCLSLAQAWRRTSGSVIFVSAEMTLSLKSRLLREGFQTAELSATPGTREDAERTIELAKCMNASWIVADSYKFGLDYQQIVKAADLRLLLLDDYGHAGKYIGDIVLNQNLSANVDLYTARAPNTRLLLGTRYALLREEFLLWRDWRREIPDHARKVLVTLGGVDSNNVTNAVLQILAGFADLESIVVVGGSNPHFEKLNAEIAKSKAQIRLIVGATDMPELMAWADVAVAASGATSWELAFMGLPSLLLVLADNQHAVAEALDRAGVAHKITTECIAGELATLLTDADGRRAMCQRGRELVDAKGAGRVTACMRSAALKLRRVEDVDCRLLWEWANDPESRAVSLSSAPIPWEEHERWFAARRRSPTCLFCLGVNWQDVPVGQIRFDISGSEALVSVSIAKEARGRGYGAALILRGSQQCFADTPTETIRAYVKLVNSASLSAFICAGYADVGLAEIHGVSVRQLVLQRGNAA